MWGRLNNYKPVSRLSFLHPPHGCLAKFAICFTLFLFHVWQEIVFPWNTNLRPTNKHTFSNKTSLWQLHQSRKRCVMLINLLINPVDYCLGLILMKWHLRDSNFLAWHAVGWCFFHELVQTILILFFFSPHIFCFGLTFCVFCLWGNLKPSHTM